jgi:uncharacterized protein YegP (UPF0339 family)
VHVGQYPCRPGQVPGGEWWKDARMAGKFEVYKDGSAGFRFRLKAGNGEVIATGEAYSSKAAALKGIESVKNNSDSDIVDLTES